MSEAPTVRTRSTMVKAAPKSEHIRNMLSTDQSFKHHHKRLTPSKPQNASALFQGN